ncbi:MAG: XRE family transcriptional regulator [Planctomycetes bacterium]|nr:XRE family transcriptional regulator [Planctomycetota bacterium]
MNKTRIKQLKAAGWKLGNTSDFLNLSAEESILIEIKITLAAGLRKERTDKGLTQQALADLLDSSQSRVAKMESADPSVSIDLLMRSLLALGITQMGLAKLLATKAA